MKYILYGFISILTGFIPVFILRIFFNPLNNLPYWLYAWGTIYTFIVLAAPDAISFVEKKIKDWSM